MNYSPISRLEVLWIGQYASEEIFAELVSKGWQSASAHVSQRNIIDALDDLGLAFVTLNAYTLPADYAERVIARRTWRRINGAENVSVGFPNIKYLAHLFRMKALMVEARQWVKTSQCQKRIVIVYGIQSSLLAAALAIKRLHPNMHICLIAPDLPQYMDLDMSPLKRALKYLDWRAIKQQLSSVDSFIVYAEPIAGYLGLKKQKYMVMEGSLPAEEVPSIPVSPNRDSTVVMYSGKLDKRFGILELLRAINLIDDQYEFWFSGSGNALDEIVGASKRDPRIKYLGFLPSRAALLQTQQRASMLINMRLPEEPSSRYSFPSKLLEYMASGRPVLSPRLQGIPEEYYNYIVEMPSVKPLDIATTILRTAALPADELVRYGQQARDFILKNKTATAQAKRIIDFISAQAKGL